MQPVAFGCFKLNDPPEVIAGAIKNGYTILDFASAYKTHGAFPGALEKSGGAFKGEIHSKITLGDIRNKGCEEAVASVLRELQVDVLDVLYLHAPDAISQETLNHLQNLKKEGKIRNIGLSNVNLSQLQGLEKMQYLPDYVQVEISPRCYDDKLIQFCRGKKITLVGYRPLGKGRHLHLSEIIDIAHELTFKQERVVTTAQVIHRWCIQKGIIPLTKSNSPHRQKENRNIYDFVLSSTQMETLNGLQKKHGVESTCDWAQFVKPKDLQAANSWMGIDEKTDFV